MDINSLLNVSRDCSCGKTHSCRIKKAVIEKGAVGRLAPLAGPYRHILLVADTHTYATCGDRVAGLLGAKMQDRLLYDCPGVLVPDEKAIALLSGRITAQTDLILGIGSGVINDLCKYVGFCRKLPYFIIATAPSMDGFASAGAAMMIGNMKITYQTRPPEAIIADTDVIRNAPLPMIQSGYGDIMGKYSALNDWELSHAVFGEYLCPYVCDTVFQMVKRVEPIGKDLPLRRDKDMQTLMEALVVVGILMSYVGNSRPASGSEHHLSHFFEVTGLLNGEPYFTHGVDVAYSAVVTQTLRERILRLEAPKKPAPFQRARWESQIRAIYSRAADGIINLQDDQGWYNADPFPAYRRHWDEIRNILSQTPSSARMKQMLSEAGLPYGRFEAQYGAPKIQNAVWFAKDLKTRYSVLWLYFHLFYTYPCDLKGMG